MGRNIELCNMPLCAKHFECAVPFPLNNLCWWHYFHSTDKQIGLEEVGTLPKATQLELHLCVSSFAMWPPTLQKQPQHPNTTLLAS
jgi:hypothetical protein